MAAAFYFYQRTDRPNKRGECPIILRITVDRKHTYLNTGERVLPEHWNDKKQEVRQKNIQGLDHEIINDRLSKILANAKNANRELKDTFKTTSAKAIKKRVDYASKDDFFDLANEYLQNLLDDNRYYPHKQAKTAIEKVRKFCKDEPLPLKNINSDLLDDLVRFMQSEYENNPATIRKNFEAIRGTLDIAVKRHLISENPTKHTDFKLPAKNGSGTKTKLTIDQIKAIEALELPINTNIWHARNAFILAFYLCGMRFGDIAELRWTNIKNERLTYDMNKTGHDLSIPIKEGTKRILDLYKSKDKTGYIFPFLRKLSISDQSDPKAVRKQISSWNALVNGKLKEIAKLCSIEDEVISMHVARHSFAFYGVNDRNIPVYKMMMLLGHKNVKTTMIYLKSLDLKTVDSVMDEIF